MLNDRPRRSRNTSAKAVSMLAACAPTFAYLHANWLVLWKVNHYFDLTKDEKVFVHGQLKELLTRQRHDALSVYEQFLSEIKSKSSGGLNRQEVDWIFAILHTIASGFL